MKRLLYLPHLAHEMPNRKVGLSVEGLARTVRAAKILIDTAVTPDIVSTSMHEAAKESAMVLAKERGRAYRGIYVEGGLTQHPGIPQEALSDITFRLSRWLGQQTIRKAETVLVIGTEADGKRLEDIFAVGGIAAYNADPAPCAPGSWNTELTEISLTPSR